MQRCSFETQAGRGGESHATKKKGEGKARDAALLNGVKGGRKEASGMGRLRLDSLSSPDRSLVSPDVVSPHPIPPAFETTHFFPFLLSVLEVLEEKKFLVFFGIFSSSSRKHVVSCCFKQELYML